MKFKIGDVVIVKSSDPPMTIHNVGDNSPLDPYTGDPFGGPGSVLIGASES